MTNVTCRLTAKKPGSALSPTLVIKCGTASLYHIILLVTESHRCEELAKGCYVAVSWSGPGVPCGTIESPHHTRSRTAKFSVTNKCRVLQMRVIHVHELLLRFCHPYVLRHFAYTSVYRLHIDYYSLLLNCLFCMYLQSHQHEFALNAAVYQLYLYADKHYETVSACCVGLQYGTYCLSTEVNWK